MPCRDYRCWHPSASGPLKHRRLPCSTMSLKAVRVTLEQDLGVEQGALKPFKDYLAGLIDKVGPVPCLALALCCVSVPLPVSA